jgi:hypothetical protein
MLVEKEIKRHAIETIVARDSTSSVFRAVHNRAELRQVMTDIMRRASVPVTFSLDAASLMLNAA